MRRLRVSSAMRPLLGSPRRTTERSADSGAAAAGLAETAVAAAAALGASKRVLAAAAAGEGGEVRRRRAEDGGEGDGERRKGARSSRAPIIADIPLSPSVSRFALWGGVGGGEWPLAAAKRRAAVAAARGKGVGR